MSIGIQHLRLFDAQTFTLRVVYLYISVSYIAGENVDCCFFSLSKIMGGKKINVRKKLCSVLTDQQKNNTVVQLHANVGIMSFPPPPLIPAIPPR